MIKVVRIAGESFDLETRQQMPKAIILSNGKREFALFVDDETARAVLALMMEVVQVVQEAPASSLANSKPAEPQVVKAKAKVEASSIPAVKDSPPMATVGDVSEMEEQDYNSGFEPGEEYNDPTTGAESL